MQNLFLVGAGPSSKTCPRWAPHFEQLTSVRIIPGREIASKRFPPTNYIMCTGKKDFGIKDNHIHTKQTPSHSK